MQRRLRDFDLCDIFQSLPLLTRLKPFIFFIAKYKNRKNAFMFDTFI